MLKLINGTQYYSFPEVIQLWRARAYQKSYFLYRFCPNFRTILAWIKRLRIIAERAARPSEALGHLQSYVFKC